MSRVVIRLSRDRVLGGVKHPAGFALGEVTLTDGVTAERLRLCLLTDTCVVEEEQAPAAADPVGEAVAEAGAEKAPASRSTRKGVEG